MLYQAHNQLEIVDMGFKIEQSAMLTLASRAKKQGNKWNNNLNNWSLTLCLTELVYEHQFFIGN